MGEGTELKEWFRGKGFQGSPIRGFSMTFNQNRKKGPNDQTISLRIERRIIRGGEGDNPKKDWARPDHRGRNSCEKG